MNMRSALFWDTTAGIPEDRRSRWITFMSGEREEPVSLKSHVPEAYSVSVAIEPVDGERAGLRNTGSHSNSAAAVHPQDLPCNCITFSYLSVRDFSRNWHI